MKNDKFKFYKQLSIILSVVLGFAIFFIIINWKTFFNYFVPPIPTVISQRTDDLSTTLLDYSIRAYVKVRNDGGSGNIALEATAIINSREVKKTTQRYFKYKEMG